MTPPSARLLGPVLVIAAAFAVAAWAQRTPAEPVWEHPTGLRPVERDAAPRPDASRFTPDELANIRVYEAANASVVHITTSTVQYDNVFGLPVEGEGAGSGAVIDTRGHVLTNQHVIAGAKEITVALTDGKTYPAELVGADEDYDIAVLRIDAPASALRPIRLGRSDNLRVGQKAYALGNPFGLSHTLTSGLVSSLNRSLPSRVDGRVMDGMIQTDAAMNPGNSGGPLLNTSAEMIGMCVAIRSSVGQNSGVGFAIPVDRIRRFVPELIASGRIVRAYHGIVMVNESEAGLRIAKLADGGPAERAGLRAFRVVKRRWREGPVVYEATELDKEHADFIVAIDGRPIATHTEFLAAMDAHKPGDRVVFTLLRSGERVDATVTLGAA